MIVRNCRQRTAQQRWLQRRLLDDHAATELNLRAEDWVCGFLNFRWVPPERKFPVRQVPIQQRFKAFYLRPELFVEHFNRFFAGTCGKLAPPPRNSFSMQECLTFATTLFKCRAFIQWAISLPTRVR